MNRFNLGAVFGAFLVLSTLVLVEGAVNCTDLSCQSCILQADCGWYNCNSTDMCLNSTEVKSGECKNATCLIDASVTATPGISIPGLSASSHKINSITAAYSMTASKSASKLASMSASKIPSASAAHASSSTSIHSVVRPSPTSVAPPPSTKAPTVGPAPTEAPTKPSAAPPAPQTMGRKFDGASFIGGMILSAGIILLGYFGWQWYRTRSRSYHSL